MCFCDCIYQLFGWPRNKSRNQHALREITLENTSQQDLLYEVKKKYKANNTEELIKKLMEKKGCKNYQELLQIMQTRFDTFLEQHDLENNSNQKTKQQIELLINFLKDKIKLINSNDLKDPQFLQQS